MKARGKIAGVIIIVALCVTGGLSFAFWSGQASSFAAKSGLYFDRMNKGVDLLTACPAIFSRAGDVSIMTRNGVANINGTGSVYCHFPVPGNGSSAIEITWLTRRTFSSKVSLYDASLVLMLLLAVFEDQVIIESYNRPGVVLCKGLKEGDRVMVVMAMLNSTHARVSISGAASAQQTTWLYNQNYNGLPAGQLMFQSWGGYGATAYNTWRLVSIRTSWDAKFPVI